MAKDQSYAIPENSEYVAADYFYQPIDKNIRQEYNNFISDNESWFIVLIFTIFLIFSDVFFIFAPDMDTNVKIRSIQIATYVICPIKLMAGLLLLSNKYFRPFIGENLIVSKVQKHKSKFQAIFTVTWTLQMCLVFIALILGGNCDQSLSNEVVFCNIGKPINSLPLAPAFILGMIPLISLTMLRQSSIWIGVSWLMCTGTLVGCTIVVQPKSFQSANYCIVCSGVTLIIIMDILRQNLSTFRVYKRLQMTLKENEQLQMQERAGEMRHLIANVAHDLKTPLSSFMVGVELIRGLIEELDGSFSEDEMNENRLIESTFSIRKCIEDITNTNQFMIMTINRCLDYTKASKGLKLVPKNETLNLKETLEMPINCIWKIKQGISIILENIPSSICSHIITDKQWLQENILCLLSNALKYSNNGDVSVSVSLVRKVDQELTSEECKPVELSLRSIDTANRPSIMSSEHLGLSSDASIMIAENKFEYLLRFDVEDSGIGVPEDMIANLFNPFRQAQRLAGGTGLGLYSLAKRVEALSGSYGVSKRKDRKQGSLFWFSIPYRPDKSTADAELSLDRKKLRIKTSAFKMNWSNKVAVTIDSNFEKSQNNCMSPIMSPKSPVSRGEEMALRVSPDKSMKENNLRNCNILMAEDSPAISKLTSMMLRRQGHKVQIAENGAIAVGLVADSVLSGERFDVILMDLQMPIMDGIEAIKRIRGAEQLCKIGIKPIKKEYIICISANSDRETMQEAVKHGANAFMEKPFKIDVFHNLLQGCENIKESSS